MSSEPKTAEVVKLPKPPVAMNARGVMLQSMDDLARFAKMYLESGMAPPWAHSAETIAVAVQTGMEAGLSPSASVRSMVVLEKSKQPFWYGQAALALIRNSRVCEFFTIEDAEGEGDARHVIVRCKRHDMPAPKEITFSVAEARRAGLLGKENWKLWGDDMLTWRAVSRAAKRYFSDVLMGLDIAEVGQDFTAVEPRPTEPPKEPDPLLSAAIDVTPSNAPEGPQAREAEIVTAETPAEPIAPQPLPSEAAEPVQTPIQTGPPEEEQRIAREVERLEGRLTMAESIEQLEKEWAERESLRDGLSDSEKKRLLKLYKQLRKNFE